MGRDKAHGSNGDMGPKNARTRYTGGKVAGSMRGKGTVAKTKTARRH